MNTEEILNKYKLSEEEHNKYYDQIKKIFTSGKKPVDNPIAVIIGGQTGAGKTGIIGYSTKMFPDNNVVIINSDEFKPFHPKSEEIARLYPELYTIITGQDDGIWTSRFFEEMRREGYNIIFEGTMKNNRVADESITELKHLGYTVVVRGLAVCDFESRMSIFERYIGQLEAKGFGRLVVPEHHNQTYEGMPNTIDYIEKTGKYDILEIYERGVKPDEPFRIYAKHNENSTDKISKAIIGKNYVSNNSQTLGYINAHESIIKRRKEQIDNVFETLEERIKNALIKMDEVKAEDNVKKMLLEFLKDFYYKKKHKELENNEKKFR